MKAVAASMIVLVLMAGGNTAPSDRGDPAPADVQRPPVRGRVLKGALKVGAYFCAGVVALWVSGRVIERRMLFQPSGEPVVTWRPSDHVEGCWFAAADGTQLFGWWHPGPGAPGRPPVVLWCHGNAGNISHRWEGMSALVDRGLAVFLFDYRGYGRSAGKPSEEGLYRDAHAAYDFLVEKRGIKAGRIVCFGRSLGAAVALDLALNRPVAGAVLEGTFANVPAMAHEIIPLVPRWYPTGSRFDNVQKVGELRAPLLMIHAEHDHIVPPGQGRSVFAAARQPKEFYVVRGAGHNDTREVGGRAYLTHVAEFCRRCVTDPN